MMRGCLTTIVGVLILGAMLWFAPIFQARFHCADPPYDDRFLADVSQWWHQEGYVHLMVLGYPLVRWRNAFSMQIEPESTYLGRYAWRTAVYSVEQHAEGNLSPYIRAAPEDVARLLTLYREIGTDRRCEPTIIGMKGDLPAEAWAELRALPEWPE